MVRTSSPAPLRSPSPLTLLTTQSDPLQQRQPAGIRRSRSADQPQERPPPSSSSGHASLPPPPNPSPGARSPSRRKLPAIPAGAANTKFPSIIRITRAQLQQVMEPNTPPPPPHLQQHPRQFLLFLLSFCCSFSIFVRLGFLVVLLLQSFLNQSINKLSISYQSALSAVT